MKKVRVAVLGYGHLGKWHCQKVDAHKEIAEFVAIVEKFPAGQEAAKANHPNVRIVSDIKEVINDIDAAFVVTPTSTHFELVKYLLENNKHVFCEKPVCSNDDEAGKLAEIAKGKNVVLQVGHSERFHEAWDKLRERMQKLTPPFTVRINRVAPFKGRATDVDVVQDLAIHDLDLMLYLFKQKPLEVTARGQRIRTNKWDHANIYLSLEDKCDAHIVVGRNSVKEMRDLEVISREGMLTIDLFTNKIYDATNTTFDDGSFVKEEVYSKRDHLLLEHGHFYKSVLESKPAIIGLKDGLNAVHLVDCTLKSMETHAPVKVNLG
ncbi:MAG: Gfo/Idh/MocA family oxidoreductase [Bacteriovoracaceae bacterium]|nr:Gfo/Idh/MocA family oxidoreductase [Bacteriovoracaceae bacterium]